MKWNTIRSTVLKHAGAIRWFVIKKSFSFWQSLGIHVTINHFYEPVPDTRTLKEDLWLNNSELIGIDMNDNGQLELLSHFVADFKQEFDNLPKNKTSTPYQYYLNNGEFEFIDGEILYCMIRHFKPKRIVEIGSGNSTYLSAQAHLRNNDEDDNECELVAIEPHPSDVLRSGFPGLTRLIPKRVQDVPMAEFERLEHNDILFIDSSHVLKIGSDVQYEYLEILPRLREGVLVHVHDIFFPSEYPEKTVRKDHIFWTEQYLLQAFLAFNDSFEVLWAGSYMRLKHDERLKEAFNSYSGQERAARSFWMRKIK